MKCVFNWSVIEYGCVCFVEILICVNCTQSRCIGNVRNRNFAVTTESALLDDGNVIMMMTVGMDLMRDIAVSTVAVYVVVVRTFIYRRLQGNQNSSGFQFKVLTSISSRQRSAISGRPLPVWTDFGLAVCSLTDPPVPHPATRYGLHPAMFSSNNIALTCKSKLTTNYVRHTVAPFIRGTKWLDIIWS